MKSNKYLDYLILCGLLLVISFSSKIDQIIQLHPESVHQWRQSDCAAYVKTYYRNGTGLFQPGTYNLAGANGRVVSEFPILYYVAAQVQHLVGEHYWVPRALTFICYISGLIALLACIKRWIPQNYFSLFPLALLASSPYYYYYAVNFLPNIPAISFSFIGLYFFLVYEEKNKIIHLLLGSIAFIMATLLKPTDGGLLWLAYVGTYFFRYLFSKSSNGKKSNPIPMMISAITVALCVFGWTKYVNWYNDLNGNHQNLVGIYPIWDMDGGLRSYTFKRIVTEWIDVFQQKYIVYLLMPLFLIYVFKWKQLHFFLRTLTLLTMLGMLTYSILWFKAFTDHDYYQLLFTLPALFLSITIMEYYVRHIMPKLDKKVSILIHTSLILIVGIGIYHNRNIQHERYFEKSFTLTNPGLFEIEPYLRKWGIDKDADVVCVPDKSPNVSLNAINNYGYTEEFNSDEYNIHTFKRQGAAYLIISDSTYLTNETYLPFMHTKIGEYKGIYVFDIR